MFRIYLFTIGKKLHEVVIFLRKSQCKVAYQSISLLLGVWLATFGFVNTTTLILRLYIMNYKLFFLAVLALIVTSCDKTDDAIELSHDASLLTVIAAAPGSGDNNPATATRLSMTMDETKISVTWKAGDKVQPYFVQGPTILKGTEITLTDEDLSAHKKNATLAIVVPDYISTANPYTLYCVHGSSSQIDGGKILVSFSYTPFFPFSGGFGSVSPDTYYTPIAASAEIHPGAPTAVLAFNYLGAMQIISFKNAAGAEVAYTEMELIQVNPADAAGFYAYKNGEGAPRYDLISKEVFYYGVSQGVISGSIWSDDVRKFSRFVLLTGNTMPATRLKVKIDGVQKESINATSASAVPHQAGNAYCVYALWNGVDLQLTDKDFTSVRK